MIEIKFLIPTRQGSSGRLHSAGAIVELHRFLEERWGWHVFPPAPGGWRNPETGEVIREESFPYFVAVPEEEVEQVRSFMRDRAKVLFDQEAIYFSVAGKVEIVDP